MNLIIAEISKSDAIEALKQQAAHYYPNECCGFVCRKDNSFFLIPSRNIIDRLGNKSLTQQNAFMIDDTSWNSARLFEIIGIYHSHIGPADISEYDKAYLRWTDLIYPIVSVQDHKVGAIKVYWYGENKLEEAIIE